MAAGRAGGQCFDAGRAGAVRGPGSTAGGAAPGGPARRRHAAHPCVDRRVGRRLYRVPQRSLRGLASDEARGTHPHPVRRHGAGARGAHARRRPAAIDLLPGPRCRRPLAAPLGRLFRIHERPRRRRVLADLPQRRRDRHDDDDQRRRAVAELARALVARGRPHGVRLDPAQRRRPRHLRDGPARPGIDTPRARAQGRRLGPARLVAGRPAACRHRVRVGQRELRVDRGRRCGDEDAADPEGRQGAGRVRRRGVQPRRPGRVRPDGPRFRVHAARLDRARDRQASLPHDRPGLGRRGLRRVARRPHDRVRHQRRRRERPAPHRGRHRQGVAGPAAADRRGRCPRLARVRPRARRIAVLGARALGRVLGGLRGAARRALDRERDRRAQRVRLRRAGNRALEELRRPHDLGPALHARRSLCPARGR